MKFAIFGNTHQAKKSLYAAILFDQLKKRDTRLYICREFYAFLKTFMEIDEKVFIPFDGDNFDVDMVISLGGDGTFLKAAERVGNKNIPILGINIGRLGFLADILPKDIERVFDEIYTGHYIIEERSVLYLECSDKMLGCPYGLNDIAVLKRDESSMITIHAAVNDKYLTTYLADGLIVATPTGSTAYSLSVGGPIIVPHSQAIVITPIAPHSLNIRPIVICDDWEITLDVETRSHNFLVAIDGRNETCEDSSRLTIRKANYTIKVIKQFEQNFFNTLRAKMMWGIDKRR
ncbi:NAD kinase [termite gut metagenome]|uniref:NAD kinase n=1 Tax=termite gut metagenome TaxID=433724 RepID=A0A5J4QQV3_9ZZZZ